jgi:hypothetical protein
VAIKGKSRGRSRGRAVARAPKPAYVAPPRPLVARTWFRLLVAAVVLVAIGGIVYGFARERSQQREREEAAAERRAIGTLKSRIDQALAGIGQAQQVTFVVLPDVVAGIERLEDGAGNPGRIGERAQAGEDAAAAAVEALGAIETTDIVEGLDVALVTAAVDSHDTLTSAVELYGQVARALREATEASGPERERLVGIAADLEPIARELFQRGYLRYLSLQADANVFDAGTGGAPLIPTG